METKKTSLPAEPPATPVEKPEEEKDKKRDKSKRDRDKEGGGSRPPGSLGPSNLEFFKLPPPPVLLCPNPKLEICLKCIRCYGASFLLVYKIFGGLLIVEGLGRLVFNVLQATTTGVDDTFYENFNYVLYYPKNVTPEAMVNFYILEKDEAIVEPFWTSLGASMELKQLQASSMFILSNSAATSQRYLFFIGIPEKLLLDVIPGLLFLLVSLSIVKGAKVKLVCTISTALAGLGSVILLIQICAIIFFILGSIFQNPIYKALSEACKNLTNATTVSYGSDNSSSTTVAINPLGCKYLYIMYFPLIGCIPLLILFIVKLHCTKAACALMRNTAHKMGAVGPAPPALVVTTPSAASSKKPEPEPGGGHPEESHEVVESAGAEVKEEPAKSEDEDEADGKKKKKDKKDKKKSKGSKKKESKGSNKKSKKERRKCPNLNFSRSFLNLPRN